MTTDKTRGRINPSECGHCLLPGRSDGVDQCIGRLPGVMNACCGHGETRWAYVQFSPRLRIAGQVARAYQWGLGRLWDWVAPGYGRQDLDCGDTKS